MPETKLYGLSDAIARYVADGSAVALGVSQETLIPFAAGHEIMRQQKRNLTLIGPISDILFDQMIGGGCVRRIRAAWVGNVITGSGYNFRRAVESGAIEMEDHSSYIGGTETAKTRLPGSGGACDLASLAKRHIILLSHEKRRFVPRVDYITSPGYGIGGDWRKQVGLPRGGPSRVITTLGMLGFDPETREMVLTAVHPGVSVDEVKLNTGWPLKVAPDLKQTPAPTGTELKHLRRFDPQGYWTGDPD